MTACPLTKAFRLCMEDAMLIYKILRRPEWDAFKAAGETAGAPVDLADGFIHFSTAAQVAETAAKWFGTESDLVLVAFNSAKLGDALKWEPSRGGALFRIFTANCCCPRWSGTNPCHWGPPAISSPRACFEPDRTRRPDGPAPA